MVALKRDSLVWRLLALLGGSYAVTALLVFVLVNTLVGSVLHRRGLEVYEQRLAAILRELRHQTERLALTGRVEVYRADFQETALRRLEEVYYHDASPETFPFIVDGEGAVRMHPWYEPGERVYGDAVLELGDDDAAAVEFPFTGPGGEAYVAVARHFEPWDWHVAYAVPEAVLAADARQIQVQLLFAWAVAAVVVLLAGAWLLIREIRPLQTLAEAAEAMGRGDLERGVDQRRAGEVGVLARVFLHMRDAIRRQLDELRESEARYRQVFDANADGLLLLDQDGYILAANPAAGAMYGWTPRQLEGRPITSLLPDDSGDLAQVLRTPPGEQPLHLEATTCDREQQELETEISAVRLSFQGRSHTLVILRDVTEQRRLERQLLQSQKLESVGRLAGGVAHDFNNLLTPVLGYTEMLLATTGLPDTAHDDLEAIRRAGERARGLARQLLAFSRRQVLEMQNLSLAAVLDEFRPILRRTLREDIDLEVAHRDADCQVQADPSQIEQIVMNLVINAMDAMPDGGRVEIATYSRTITRQDRHTGVDLLPGRYSALAVRDTGAGVPPEIVDRVFEPFFTTKETGKGTGLGLSTIHGIVTQHGGWVGLRNRPEGGCEVEVLLPCVPESELDATADEVLDAERVLEGRGEHVWLVEDDEMVRDLVHALLERHGYAVDVFVSGTDCLARSGAVPPAAIVLTDVVMPGMNGPEMRDQLRTRGFTMPVLFMSGYAGETLVRRGLADARADFILKPIEPQMLLQKLRRMLDAERERA